MSPCSSANGCRLDVRAGGARGQYRPPWNHFTQLRLYLKRSWPLESSTLRHTGLSFYMSFFRVLARADAAARPFTFTMDFTGPGGGPFTFRVTDGCCMLSEARVSGADLVITQAPETFVKTSAHMHNPCWRC